MTCQQQGHTAMTATTSAPGEAPDWGKLSGRLVLVGAGKMGSALLQGWLRLGLDPGTGTVLEPQPSPQLVEMANRGLQLNPAAGALGPVAAIVIAVKPQVAA